MQDQRDKRGEEREAVRLLRRGSQGPGGGALLLRHLGCPLEAHIVLRMCDFNVLLWVRGKFDLALLSAKEHGL